MYDKKSLLDLENIDLNIKHHFSDSIYAKEMCFPEGYIALSHKHTYSHLSVLAEGSCIVTYMIEGEREHARAYTAPSVIEIKAGIEHQIEAITDVTWLCIHATEEKDVSKIDTVLIERKT